MEKKENIVFLMEILVHNDVSAINKLLKGQDVKDKTNNKQKKDYFELQIGKDQDIHVIKPTVYISNIKNVNLNYIMDLFMNDKDYSAAYNIKDEIQVPDPKYIMLTVAVFDDQDIEQSELIKYKSDEIFAKNVKNFIIKSGFNIMKDDSGTVIGNFDEELNKFLEETYKVFGYYFMTTEYV